MKNLVKTLKVNKLLHLTGKIEMNEKYRQNSECKQTFEFDAKK